MLQFVCTYFGCILQTQTLQKVLVYIYCIYSLHCPCYRESKPTGSIALLKSPTYSLPDVCLKKSHHHPMKQRSQLCSLLHKLRQGSSQSVSKRHMVCQPQSMCLFEHRAGFGWGGGSALRCGYFLLLMMGNNTLPVTLSFEAHYSHTVHKTKGAFA